MRWPGTEYDVESFDYDPCESQVDASGLQYNYQNGKERKRLVYARWICTLVIGFATALCAVFLHYFTVYIFKYKQQLLQDSIQSEKVSETLLFAMILGGNLVLVLCSTFCIVFGENIASGSGISEIKTMLNGVKIPKVLRLRTLICKLIGTVCSVASGLPVGKEGPMIHSGAIVAAGLSQGKSSTLGYDTSYFSGFRNDHEKRDFVCCGAAAGVAAAFGAPIGGVLFVLEEGASFWHQTLTWRTFFCAMMSSFTLALFLSGFDPQSHFGTLGSQYGTFSFGHLGSSTYQVWEVLIFICMGVGGGISGALFNAGNTKITKWRARWITRKSTFILEAVVVSTVISTLSFGLPYFLGTCHTRPGLNGSEIITTSSFAYDKDMIPLYCEHPNSTYNDLATLFLSPGENAIKQLFHAPAETFSFWNLVLFYIIYILIACWTYGLKVPSGLFVPSLLIGAAYGRIWTYFINSFTNTMGLSRVDERTYGLIGGAAMLGGVTRMTISLTVILLECTGSIQYGLPLMVTLFSARWVGNYFNEGIYDIHIHLKHLPFLDWNPPVLGTFLKVRHVMSRNPKCLQTIEKAGIIYDMLLNSSHNGFPVYLENENIDEKLLAGIVLRKHLSVILSKKDFTFLKPKPFSRKPPPLDQSDNPNNNSFLSSTEGGVPLNDTKYCLSYRDIEGHYPRYPRIHLGECDESIQVKENERQMWVDLTPYMNQTPYVIQEDAAFTRAYRLFRNSGLRHLIVVEKHNYIRGIITRKDLEDIHCTRCFRLAKGRRSQTRTPSLPSFIMGQRDDMKNENAHLNEPFILEDSNTSHLD